MSENSKATEEKSARDNNASQDAPQQDLLSIDGDMRFGNDRMFDDDLFTTFPEGTRIFIEGNSVTFENMTPDLAEVAQSLNPEDKNIAERAAKTRKKSRKKT